MILTGADYKKYNCYFVTKAEKSFSASVFHELLHFFHILRNIERRDMEKVSNNCAFTVLSPSTIGRFYYTQKEGHNDHYRTKHTTLPWVTRNPTYNQEEHRTICGVPLPKQSLNQLTEDANSSEPKYLAGDELSENAFLFSLQHQLRDGHSDFNFYEDSDVVKKIFDVASFSNDEKAREQLDKILWCGKDMVYSYDRMEKGCLYLGASCIAELGVGEFLIPGGRKDK